MIYLTYDEIDKIISYIKFERDNVESYGDDISYFDILINKLENMKSALYVSIIPNFDSKLNNHLESLSKLNKEI